MEGPLQRIFLWFYFDLLVEMSFLQSIYFGRTRGSSGTVIERSSSGRASAKDFFNGYIVIFLLKCHSCSLFILVGIEVALGLL